MDWLKDKKNQPIVAAALAVIIIGVGVVVYFTMFAGKSAPTTTDPTAPGASGGTAAPTTADMAGYPPGTTPMPDAAMPGTPDATASPGAAAAAPAPTPPGGAVPMEVSRSDPFLPAGYKPPPKNVPKPKPPIRDLPFGNWSQVPIKGREKLIPDLVQPVRRMAGLIVSDRIYAIIETNGLSQIVQPGDVLDDRLAKVERIERDKVVLKTMDKVPKYITVRMTSAPRTASTVTPSTSGSEGVPSPTGSSGRPRPYPVGPVEPMQPM